MGIIKHGDARTRIYKIWLNMVHRCCNSKVKDYPYYGGRGITVCDEWKEYPPFKEWAAASRYDDSLTLERKDVDGNYTPINCTWIPRLAQARNRRDSRYLTAFGETKLLIDWKHDYRRVCSPEALWHRLNRGMVLEAALTTPLDARGSWSRSQFIK